MDDPFGLRRFVEAQEAGHTYAQALDELGHGAKRSHWMWFVFPQVAGLGSSTTSQRFAIASLEEARAYLAHPVLGPRLLECAGLLAAAEHKSAEKIFGVIDALKLRSSMTLFHRADPDQPVFLAVLHGYFNGETDPRTEGLLGTI